MAGLKFWQDKGKAIVNPKSIHVAPAGAKIQNGYKKGWASNFSAYPCPT